MTLAVVTFLGALAVIATERVHRTKVALLGAAIVALFVGDFGQEEAIDSVDFNTIGLLAGMMVLVYLTQQSGIYDYIAIRAGQLSRGDPLRVVLSMATTTAVLSAFLDNLTTILLIVPITFLLADTLDIDPIPLIVIEVIASNIGGTATLIGDPPNIIIAGRTGLSFNEFLVNLAPIVIVVFLVIIPLLYLSFRPQLQVAERNRRYVMDLNARASIRDEQELRRTVPVLVGTIVLFFAHQVVGANPSASSRSANRWRSILSRSAVEDALALIDAAWPGFFPRHVEKELSRKR